MESYDTVIVGAGPGGLNCAHALAESGQSVLLLERHERIGPKVCAGALSERDISYLNLPDKLVDRAFDEMTLHTPHSSNRIRLDEPVVFSVDRERLGQWQLQKLKNTDVEVRTGAEVTGVAEDHVIINSSEKIGFTSLVGADGSASIVRKFLDLGTREIGIAIQYILPLSNRESLELFFDSKLFQATYVWIIPHKDYISVGTGCDPRFIPAKDLRQSFDIWLDKQDIDRSGAKLQSCPINCDYRGYRFGNQFLVGDAAGLATAFAGEGIYEALRSGEEVARMILDPEYRSDIMKWLIVRNRFQINLVHLLEHFGRFRAVFHELLARSMRNKLIARRVINLLL